MATDAQLTAAVASTTEAVAADTASRGEGAAEAPKEVGVGARGGAGYLIGDGVQRAPVVPYERKKGDPLYRPLRIYTADPSLARLDGAIATVNVAFEPLSPGPVGQLFEVDSVDHDLGTTYRSADLDDRDVLLSQGYAPSPSDPRFHQQMVYAVCSNVYSAFSMALGRNLSWGFGGRKVPAKLLLRPHYRNEANAYYSKEDGRGELRFGYFEAVAKPMNIRSLPGGFVFSCLSQDIVVHEVTHALLDGLREHFTVPTSTDVIAFHEAFADLVAIFQHFSYAEVVLMAIRRCHGALQDADLLTQLAVQFGHTTGQKGPLRTAIDRPGGPPRQYEPEAEPHELGSVLVSAVFEAFVRVFQRKTERYLRLATGGSGVLPPGEMAHDLQTLLAERASKLAGQFLAICIRAIDYCPPTGLTFGDYLRALITADHDLVPDDRWDYRGALIDAFGRRNIYPRSVSSLSEDALLWHGTRKPLDPVPGLDFANLRFRGDPAQAAGPVELHRQACAFGSFAADPAHLEELGLVANGDPRLGGNTVSPPCVESIRSARRSGPSGQIVFDLVAEITQECRVAASQHGPEFRYHGGATVIMDPLGEIRYAIVKSVVGDQRVGRRRQFLASACAQRYWALQGNAYLPRGRLFELTHRWAAQDAGGAPCNR